MTQERERTPKITDIPMPAAVLLALVLSLLTSGLLIWGNKIEHVNNTTIALIYLLPVGICASLWGLVPGAAAALLSFLSFNFFFIPELFTFQVKQTEDLIVLVAFLSVAFVISELTGRVRRNLHLATVREYESKRLYELNTLLTGTRDERTAARIMLEKIDQTLHPDRVEILIESKPKSLLLALGLSSPKIISKRPFIMPLQTTRDLIGEIRLWPNLPTQEAEERILNIIASQGVLTIERIRLGEEARKNRVLEETDRLKTSLLSSVSHELRSPLAAIKASVSSLRSEEIEWDNPARVELLTMVEEEIDHLNMLVGNLLDMSRIEAGVLKPEKKPNILIEIVNTVLGRMRPQLQNWKVVVDVSEDLPLVDVDYVQMQQVFSNLLTNSLKYSPPGSTIQINAKRLAGNFILVVLKNQSLPFPEDDMLRIFDKFYRINPSDRSTGTGLGLSICKGIIEAHGGKIWAENSDDGIAFNFTLPVITHD